MISNTQFSDLWKSINGSRPTEELILEWESRTVRQQNELWAALVDELSDKRKEESNTKQIARGRFENTVNQYMAYGDNITREDAIRFILEENGLTNRELDADEVVYWLGLPYDQGYEEEFKPFIKEWRLDINKELV